MPSTRLLDPTAARADDEDILAMLRQLVAPAPVSGRVYTAALLNEAGVLYRDVELVGDYQALQFTAHMNARGFVQVPQDAIEGYTSVFCKP